MRIKTNLLLAFMAIATISQAQWTDDLNANTEVVSVNNTDLIVTTAPTGETFAFFWKNVGQPQNLQLRMQVLDTEGVPQLGDEGVVVTDSIPMSTFTLLSAIAVDADNNVIIAITSSAAGNNGHVYKLDLEGNLVWEHDAISYPAAYAPQLLPLSNGELILAWLNGGSGQTNVQKFDADGNAIWANAATLEIESPKNAPAALHEMSDGGIMILLHGFNFGVASMMYAQRLDADGANVWAQATQITNVTTAYNKPYSTVQDGDIVYLGFNGAVNNRFDAYLQCILPDGTIPWGMNGSDFDTTTDEFEMNVEIAYSEGSDYIWANSTYTNSSQGAYGEYIQKFDKASGERMLTDEAKAVYTISSELGHRHAGALTLVDDEPLFVMQVGTVDGVSPITIQAVYLNENGDFKWADETRPMATYEAPKTRINFSEQINGQNVLVFSEDRGDGSKIYAQNLTDLIMTNSDDIIEDLSLMFQNPIPDEFNLTSGERLESITIYDVLGKVVYNQQKADLNTLSINTSNWNTGLYLLSVKTKLGQSKGIKLIKQ